MPAGRAKTASNEPTSPNREPAADGIWARTSIRRRTQRAHLADVRLTVVRHPHESDHASYDDARLPLAGDARPKGLLCFSDRLAQEAYEPPRTSASIFPPTCLWSGLTTTRSPDACARR